jgi:hypothetical protein
MEPGRVVRMTGVDERRRLYGVVTAHETLRYFFYNE